MTLPAIDQTMTARQWIPRGDVVECTTGNLRGNRASTGDQQHPSDDNTQTDGVQAIPQACSIVEAPAQPVLRPSVSIFEVVTRTKLGLTPKIDITPPASVTGRQPDPISYFCIGPRPRRWLQPSDTSLFLRWLPFPSHATNQIVRFRAIRKRRRRETKQRN